MMKRTQARMRLCVCLLAVLLLFIWGNSLLPGTVSGAFSQWVKTLLEGLFPGLGTGDTESGHHLLRKLAHFSEFCCLGLCLSWLLRMLRTRSWEHILLPLLLGCLAACVDETIQLLVPERGPSIKDVGIDTLGAALGMGLMTLWNVLKKERTNDH